MPAFISSRGGDTCLRPISPIFISQRLSRMPKPKAWMPTRSADRCWAWSSPPIWKRGAWTGGVQGLVVSRPDVPFGLPIGQDMWLYYFTLAITLAIYGGSLNLLRSRSGRAFMAIRDNEISASAMGVNVALYKTLAFGVSAGITGIAGGLGAIAVQFGAPDGYAIVLAISLFLGMVVGGVGWLPGSIVGSAFIIFVPNIAEGICN